jgi:hypothetical protein
MTEDEFEFLTAPLAEAKRRATQLADKKIVTVGAKNDTGDVLNIGAYLHKLVEGQEILRGALSDDLPG